MKQFVQHLPGAEVKFPGLGMTASLFQMGQTLISRS